MTPELSLSLAGAIASYVAVVLIFLVYCDVVKVRSMLSAHVEAAGLLTDDRGSEAGAASDDICVSSDADGGEKIEIARGEPKGVVVPSKAHKWSVDGVEIPPGRDLENHYVLVVMGDFLSYLGIAEPAENASLSSSAQSPYNIVEIAINQGIFDWKDLDIEDRLIIAKIVRFELRMAARLHPERKTLRSLEMVNDFVERYGPEFGVMPMEIYW